MEVIIRYKSSEEQKANDLKDSLKQLHRDFGGFAEAAKAKLEKVQ